MEDRSALLLAWLEEEGERQGLSPTPPPVRRPISRGWVHVGVCVFLGGLVAAWFVCWLGAVWGRSVRVDFAERLRREGIRRHAEGTPLEEWRVEGGAKPGEGGRFGGAICFGAFAVAFGTVIGSPLFFAGVLLHNRLAGGRGAPACVPVPRFGRAMGITFVTSLVDAALCLEIRPTPVGILASALAGLLVMAVVSSALLPTSFNRGLLVASCYVLVGAFVFAALAVVLGGLSLAHALLR